MSGQPFSFTSGGLAVAGFFHSPATPTRAVGVVLCNAFGEEWLSLHLTYRGLAEGLAARGIAALRFDYPHCGDSAGMDGGFEVDAALASIADAVRWMREQAGVARVVLVGVRFGGLLAAAAPGIADGLVAWAPFASGRLFLREFRMLRQTQQSLGAGTTLPPPAPADPEDSLGYRLSCASVARLAGLDLLTADRSPAPWVLLLHRDDLPANAKLPARWRELGATVEEATPAGYAPMLRVVHDAVRPDAALADLIAAIERRFSLAREADDIPLPPYAIDCRSPWGPQVVVERPMRRFGYDGRLFGVLSQPERVTGPALVLVSSGANHRAGPAENYVRLARGLAANGIPVLRFDIAGVGDSPARTGRPDNVLYDEQSIDDTMAAAQALQAEYPACRVLLSGICSGGYLAFRAAAARGAAGGAILINTKVYSWTPGQSLDDSMRRAGRTGAHYKRALFNPETFRRLVRGKVDVRAALHAITMKIGNRIRTAGRRFRDRLIPPPPDQRSPTRLFHDLLQRGAVVNLVYSVDDGGLDEMELHLGLQARELAGYPRFNFTQIPDADHTFRPIATQKALFDQLLARLSLPELAPRA